MEQTPIISIQKLRKSYGLKKVLRGIDLDIQAGQVIGYIGPNGAGKSTTVRILIGLDGAFEGEAIIDGINVRENPLEIKKIIGYVPEYAELYEGLSPNEFLYLIGKLHDMEENLIRERAKQMLGYFGLSQHIDQRMDTFSKGMRQKVLLTSGLLHNPKIIFLDEPLTGLDANTVILVKEIIDRLAKEGKTIFYCSHMMDVVEKVSDRIILINDGKIIADGSFDELQAIEGGSLESVFSKLTGNIDTANQADEFLKSFNDE